MKTAPVIQFERRIAARPETVFSYFTDPERYTAWMGVEAELDARPGGIYRVRVPQGYVARGEFVEVEPPHRIVFTWGWEDHPDVPPGSTTVTVTFDVDADATLLRLLHEGLPDDVARSEHTNHYLDRLTGVASG